MYSSIEEIYFKMNNTQLNFVFNSESLKYDKIYYLEYILNLFNTGIYDENETNYIKRYWIGNYLFSTKSVSDEIIIKHYEYAGSDRQQIDFSDLQNDFNYTSYDFEILGISLNMVFI